MRLFTFFLALVVLATHAFGSEGVPSNNTVSLADTKPTSYLRGGTAPRTGRNLYSDQIIIRGCYTDKDDRALPYRKITSGATLGGCASACFDSGFENMGLQADGECWCGNNDDYAKHGESTACNCHGPHFGNWVNCVYSNAITIGYHQIKTNKQANLCMDIIENNWDVIMSACNSQNNNQWWRYDVKSKQIRAKRNDGICLINTGKIDWCYDKLSNKATQWTWDSATQRLRSEFDTTMCLDIKTEGSNDVYSFACHDGSNQKFSSGTFPIQFKSTDGKYVYSIDLTAADPDLAALSENQLKPVMLEWYPKIVSMLPSNGFTAPTSVTVRFLPRNRDGVAYASGSTIAMFAGYISRNKDGATGVLVHEMVHVVQSYTTAPGPPGWFTEGVADYIRWFLYQPDKRGILPPDAKYDGGYQVSANFIDWVIRTYDGNGRFLQKLNEAARQGKYSTDIWKQLTGFSEGELAEKWVKRTN